MLPNKSFVYFGTSSFSAQILTKLVAAGLVPELVVTTKGKPAGRGLGTAPTPVAEAAAKSGLLLQEVSSLKTPEVQSELQKHSTEFAILAAFGKIIPPAILHLYPKGIVNVHPSLLPLLRGPAPIQCAIREQHTKTGVSLIILDEEIDHGPVLAQSSCAINDTDDAVSLADTLCDLAVSLLLKTILQYLTGTMTPVPQEHTLATFTQRITRESGQIDFTKDANELNAMRRAYTPWPGLWTTWQGQRIKFVSTTVSPTQSIQPGKVESKDNQLMLGCGHGALVIHSLQLEGGKVLNATDFLRGHAQLLKAVLPN